MVLLAGVDEVAHRAVLIEHLGAGKSGPDEAGLCGVCCLGPGLGPTPSTSTQCLFPASQHSQEGDTAIIISSSRFSSGGKEGSEQYGDLPEAGRLEVTNRESVSRAPQAPAATASPTPDEEGSPGDH